MYRKYGVGKLLALVKTLQKRLQKSRSYNTNKELMESDSLGGGGGGGGELLEKRGGGIMKVTNVLVPFRQAGSLGGCKCMLNRAPCFFPWLPRRQ